MAHLRQPPPRLTAAAPWLPVAFDSVIATAMAKDPAARYPSGQALAAAAQAALRTLNAAPDPAAATQRAATVAPPRYGHAPAAPPAAPGWPPQGAAPAGYPPHYGAPGGPRRTRRTALLAGAVVVALLAGAITAIVLTRRENAPATTATPPTTNTSAATATAAAPAPAPPAPTTTTPPPAPVDDADLPTLLLPPDQLNALLGANPAASPPASGIANDASTVTPTQCISALLPMQRLALDNTGFRAGYSQQFTPSTPADPRASQGVVSFPSAEMAAAFITREEQLWQPCGNQVLTLSGNGGPDRSYQLAAPTRAGDVLTINANRLGPPLQCQHALTARSNIVVDVTTCMSSAVTDQASKIARAIAALIK
jgi:serine/threonine-protein kinase